MGLYRKELDFKVISINKHRMKTDGNGVTTLVALLGCPLRCRYCINKNVLTEGNYRTFTVDSLIEEVMSDYCYYVATRGGVTFGGGESLLWSEKILEFREKLKEDVSVNVETSMNLNLTETEENREIFTRLLEDITEFIIDIKAFNPEIYKAYTGRNNINVLRNLEYIAENGYQDKCHLRVPIIPNFKTPEEAEKDREKLLEMGFRDIEIFEYVLRNI